MHENGIVFPMMRFYRIQKPGPRSRVFYWTLVLPPPPAGFAAGQGGFFICGAAMKLSTYFSYEELTQSDWAARHGVANDPGPQELESLKFTASQLDRVRALLGVPVLVSSGFRCQEVNTAIGGAKNSQHTLGQAVDFTAPSFGTPEQVARAIQASHIPFDQLIFEFCRWVHISFAKQNPRGQVLTIDRNGTRQGIVG